jgi:putative colanic acid biosynthesis glycosyltransferase WcaE
MGIITKGGNRTTTQITVVTVVYNAVELIERTIRSIIGQKFDNFEYIVIDGGSTDGTQNKINKYLDNIDVIVSERDSGIYDAMNKAITLAKGEWIIFINADDWFVDDKVLYEVSPYLTLETDFVYGDHESFNGVESILVPARPLNTMWQRISFSHQSLFSRTDLMVKNKFDLKKNIVADYNFYFSCYSKGCKFKYLDRVISVISEGGFSSVSFSKRTWQRWHVVAKEMPSIKIHIFYAFLYLWNLIPLKIRRLLKNNINGLTKLP